MRVPIPSRPFKPPASAGMTLIELTVVILVILSLISVLMLGASAWKTGADRTNCLLHVASLQKAARSYQNMRSLEVGAPFAPSMVIGPGKFFLAHPVCPAGDSTYGFVTEFPPGGVPFMSCSIGNHAPTSTADW